MALVIRKKNDWERERACEIINQSGKSSSDVCVCIHVTNDMFPHMLQIQPHNKITPRYPCVMFAALFIIITLFHGSELLTSNTHSHIYLYAHVFNIRTHWRKKKKKTAEHRSAPLCVLWSYLNYLLFYFIFFFAKMLHSDKKL